MTKAVFLDRDGTINVDKDYLYRIDEFQYLPGVVNALKRFQEAGYVLIIITNQSGIARGYYSEYEFQVLNNWMLDDLKVQGVHIDGVYYCPHLPNADVEKYRTVCDCRKPAIGMFERAMKEYNIDMGNSLAIGDKLRDCAVCQKYGCKGYLVGKNETVAIINSVINGEYKNIEYAESLLEVADKVLELGTER